VQADNEDEEQEEQQLDGEDEDEGILQYSPSLVPEEEEARHEYLLDLCGYSEYQVFVDTVFGLTVSTTIWNQRW
jgi:hypothetical protein